MLSRHATKLLDTLPIGDSVAVAGLVDQFISSLKPHLSDESMSPLISELLSSAFAKIEDTAQLRDLLVAVVEPLRRITGGDASTALFCLIHARDEHVASHHRAVESVARRLGIALDLDAVEQQRLVCSARIFDVGKLLVPRNLLHGDFELTNETWPALKRHVEEGLAVIEAIPQLAELAPLVRHHHERYDGFGYPDRLSGEAIPMAARILALADAWHAMLSPRAFRLAAPVSEVLLQVSDGRGRQWDPRAVDALLTLVWGDRHPAALRVS